MKGKGPRLLHRAARAPAPGQRGAAEAVLIAIRARRFTVPGAGTLAVLGLLLLTACSSSPPRPDAGEVRKPGGYYLDDGPGANPPANLDQIPDPEPKAEPIKASTMRPYTAFGRTYAPMTKLSPYQARGMASWYGKRYHGQATASGEAYDMYAMTAAHPTLPIPSYAHVTNLRTGKTVVVRINDRGPFRGDRLIDLSYAAAYKLGIVGSGSDLVEVESIIPGGVVTPPGIEASTTGQTGPASAARPPGLATAEEPAGVYVQLGAFSLRQNAESFLARMRTEVSWLAGAIGLYVRDGVYRVHAGPYTDRAQADQVATRIEQSLDVRPVVISR
ncbi:MAG TPA: septal ring lytic transglycosylase RlpA family protein [Burkholderiales bacterium]|nr:septal ring lytic transglycosylase RlpA family protein [Burkholderiales bacterium]